MTRLLVTLQYLLPHHLLCRLVYALTRSRRPWLKNILIRAFVHRFRPRMAEAVEPDPLCYASFNDFFTRALQPALRPLEPDPRRIAAPCDGVLSIAATLRDDTLLQAKGHSCSLRALLGGAPEWTARLRGGAYATLYLAPYDYHRVHMPLAGRLRAAWHVPGRLFSVNAATVERVPGLFAHNERVICAFDGDQGPFAVVLVGALLVGSIGTVWHGEITPWRRRRRAGETVPTVPAVHLLQPGTGVDPWQPRGAELGRFNMGSTVILLLPPGAVTWDGERAPGASVQVGQGLGRLAPGTRSDESA